MALLWSGRVIAGESLRNLKTVIEHIVNWSIQTDIAVFILVSYLVAELVAEDLPMSLDSTESHYGRRHINGVPVWNGDILTRDYETAALWFRAGLTLGEQERAVGSFVGKSAVICERIGSNVQTSIL